MITEMREAQCRRGVLFFLKREESRERERSKRIVLLKEFSYLSS